MRINKKFVIKSGIYALIFIFFTVLETNMLAGLRIFGAKPNLVISLVVAAAVVESEKYAAAFGMICGFLVDSSVGSPLFSSGLQYFFAAYLIANLTKSYFRKSLFTMCIMSLSACLLREFFNFVYLLAVWGNFDIKRAILEFILPEYIYTVALAPAVYLLVKLTAGKISYNIM
ncbi:MAG: rod shape-determining protein MreD [Oscillospiraceae bacterium]|nr:rod shape-determining protein MreD [Oscillospiraceae bacterium]